MKVSLFLLLCFPLFSAAAFCQGISRYVLDIEKEEDETAVLRFRCSFTIDFEEADSVCMRFGGNNEFSIDELNVEQESGAGYRYDTVGQRIVFYRNRGRASEKIVMDYVYTNISAAFIYGQGCAELWETGFNEHYYPYIPQTYMDVEMSVSLPDSLALISAYPVRATAESRYRCRAKHIPAHSLSLGFLQKEAYNCSVATIPDTIQVWQIKGMECPAARYDELVRLTRASLDYFGRTYQEGYLSDSLDITAYPTFLFHNGKGFSNRYNIGFISASQEKFSTYSDIYPLIHEIGHRWLGEWTLLIDDGEPGAYFIKESLNEFMTFMFIRDHFGEEAYRKRMERCEREYWDIRGTTGDTPLIEMRKNNNNTVVYCKGPLVLDGIAQSIGYDRLVAVIARFYQRNKGRRSLTCRHFIEVLAEKCPEAGRELERRLRE